MSKQKKKQQNLNVVAKSDAAKKKKKKKPSTNGHVSSKSGDRLKNLLTCPDSVLTESNIKVFVNEEAFLKLPSYLQYKLISMLPKCDQNLSKDGGHVLSEEAFSNEFFTKACEEWRSKLAEGCFTDDRLQHMSIERGRQQAIDAWKIRHFESTVSTGVCTEGPLDPAGKKRKCEGESESAGGNGCADSQEPCGKKLKIDLESDAGDSRQLHVFDRLRLSFVDQSHFKTDVQTPPGAGSLMQSKMTDAKQSKRNHKIRSKLSEAKPSKMVVSEKPDEGQKGRLNVNAKLLLKNQIESRRERKNDNKNKPTLDVTIDRTTAPVTSKKSYDNNNNEQNSKKMNDPRSSLPKSRKPAASLANCRNHRTGDDVRNNSKNKTRSRQVAEELHSVNCKDSEESKTPGTSRRSASGKRDETLFDKKETSRTNDTVTLSDLISREYELLSRGTSGPKSTAILKPESLKFGFLNGAVSYSSSPSPTSRSIKNGSSFSYFSPSSSSDSSLKTFLQSPTRKHETINSPLDHSHETSSTDTVISDASEETLFARQPSFFSFNGLRPLAEIYPLLGKSLREVKAESQVVEPSVNELTALPTRQKPGAVERETLLSLVNKLNRNSSSRTGGSIFDLLQPLPHSEVSSTSTSSAFSSRKERSFNEIGGSTTSLSNALLAKLSKCLTTSAPASSKPTSLLQQQAPDFKILKNILSSGSKLPLQTFSSPDSTKMTLQSSSSQLELLTKKFLPQFTQDGGLYISESRAASVGKEKVWSTKAPVSVNQNSNHSISIGLVTKCNDATDVMIPILSCGHLASSQSSSPAKCSSVGLGATTSSNGILSATRGDDPALCMPRSATEVSSDHHQNTSPSKLLQTMPDEKTSPGFLHKPFFLTLSSTEQTIPTILVHHLPTNSQKLRPPLPLPHSAGYLGADRSLQSRVSGSRSPSSNLTVSQQQGSLPLFFSSSSLVQSNNSSKLSLMGGNSPRLQGGNTISTSLSSMAAMTNQVLLQNLIFPQRLTAPGSNNQQSNAASKFVNLPIVSPSIPQIRRTEGQFLMPTQPSQSFGLRSGPTVGSFRALDKTSPQLPIAALLAQNAARSQTNMALSSQLCKIPQSIPNFPPTTSMSLIILSPFGQQQQGNPLGAYSLAPTTVRPQNESMRSSELLSNSSLQVNPMLTYLPLLTMAQSAPVQHVSPGGNGNNNGRNQQQIVFLPTQNNSPSVAVGGSMSPYMAERATPCNGALKNLTFIPIVNGNSNASGVAPNNNQLLFLLSPQANNQK